MAYWAERFREKNPQAFIVEHYVGSGQGGVDHIDVIRRVMLEINARFDIAVSPPTTSEELIRNFPAWLWYVREPMILIVDALNQMPGESPDLSWLPSTIPPPVRIILTTTSAETVRQVKNRGWNVLSLKPFSLAERRRVVEQFVADRGARLTSVQIRSVGSDPGSAHPLLLRTRLEEAWAAAERGEKDAIGYYLEAANIDQMYEQVLARVEARYGKALVRQAMSLMILVREGLRKEELASLVGEEPASLDGLIKDLGVHLLPQADRLVFYHDSLPQAIRRRYELTAEAFHYLHYQLGAFFQHRLPPDAASELFSRCADNGAYHWSLAADNQQLEKFLVNIPVMLALYNGPAKFRFLQYWKMLEGSCEIETAYRESLLRFERSGAALSTVAYAGESIGRLLRFIGRMNSAEEFLKIACRYAEQVDDKELLAKIHDILGDVCRRLGKQSDGENYLRRALELALQIGDRSRTGKVYLNLGNIYAEHGDYVQALKSLGTAADILREGDDQVEYARVLSNIGAVYIRQGRYDAARRSLRQALQIVEEVQERAQIADIEGRLGIIEANTKNDEQACVHYQRQYDISQELGNRAGAATAIGNLGNVYYRQGNLSAALAQYELQRRLAEECGDRRQIFVAYSNSGMILAEQGHPHRALEYLRNAAALARRLGDPGFKFNLSGRLGRVYMLLEDLRRALAYYTLMRKQAEAIGNSALLSYAWGGVGEVYLLRGEFAQAESALIKQRDYALPSRNLQQQGRALHNLGIVYRHRKEYRSGVECFEKALALYAQVEDKVGRAHSLYECAVTLFAQAEADAERREQVSEHANSPGSGVRAGEECGGEDRVRLLAEEVATLAEEIEDKALAFDCVLLRCRVLCNGTEEEREKALRDLKQLSRRQRPILQRARLARTLSECHRKSGLLTQAASYSAKAGELYSTLHDTCPDSYEYAAWATMP